MSMRDTLMGYLPGLMKAEYSGHDGSCDSAHPGIEHGEWERLEKEGGKPAVKKAGRFSALTKGSGAPSGYRPMKHSKHGGYVSADGKKSWYPSKANAKKDMDHHADRMDHHVDEAKSAHHAGDHEFKQAHNERSLHHDDMHDLASKFHKQPKEAKKKEGFKTAAPSASDLEAVARATGGTRKQTKQGSREYDSARRGNQTPKGSNWTGFAKKMDIGVLDLDNIADDMGHRDFEHMDISIGPKDMAEDEAQRFVEAVKRHSSKAENMPAWKILDAATGKNLRQRDSK